MRTLPLAVLATAALVPAQITHSVVTTDRFWATGLDQPNERPGGSINQHIDHDICVVTPNPSLPFSRKSWWPTTALDAYWGDAYGDNNYTRFDGFAAPGTRWDIAALFVKQQDRARRDPRDVYWTVRDNLVNQNMRVLTNTGTATAVIQPGDFVRFEPNGNIEYFITAQLFLQAKGNPPVGQAEKIGASALCQDAAGNLYWSPEEGGQWVDGNSSAPPIWCKNGSVIMLDAANITYDANGNVSAVVPGSAHVLFLEDANGPNGQAHMQNFMANANAQDISGFTFTDMYNIVGMDIDPNGGTVTSSWPVGDAPNEVFPVVPNLIWCVDNGTPAGTIWSTANGGSVAVINGVQCGSTVPGVPGTGAWLGVQLGGPGSFSPTLMGLQVIPALTEEPLVTDAPSQGSLRSTDANILVDMHGEPGLPMFLFISIVPSAPGQFLFAADIGFLSPIVAPGSWFDFFPLISPLTASVGAADAFGYATFSAPNPIVNPINQPTFAGVKLVCQSAQFRGLDVKIGNPAVLQFK